MRSGFSEPNGQFVPASRPSSVVLLQLHTPFAEVHQDLIYGQTVEPGRKRRVAAKATNLAEQLNKGFLREVFGLGNVVSHPQTDRIDATIVSPIKLFEGRSCRP